MTRKKRGCLVLLVVALLLAAAVAVGTALFLPGDLQFGGRAPAPAAAVQPVSLSGPGGSLPAVAPAPDPAPVPEPAPGAWMTYVIPNDILQAELKKAFPVRLNVVELVKLQLDRPTFIADPDGAFLRLRLEVEARVLEGDQRLPGSAIVRTQLRYDRATRRVTLRNAQLVELSFTGSAASAAGVLQPVLAQALAAEMEGYVIFEVPADGLWWLKTGIGFVRDVYVKDGRVAIGLGP